MRRGVKTDKYEVVRIIYTQDKLNFVEMFIMKKYCPSNVGYTIKVIDANTRSSKILVRRDKMNEFLFLCSNCNIDCKTEITRVGTL